ncbi:hypothetical protein NDU88_003963 [Pleurodeles waltl]|uniref:Uncharacterized protein n=1 Tax=Pleurodeles waltl TaxID=8319 RepID=A0AAV7QBJ4_PLEWA|nr:hypothetical protein NDU88_003963 [Pleurodeles waltl]
MEARGQGCQKRPLRSRGGPRSRITVLWIALVGPRWGATLWQGEVAGGEDRFLGASLEPLSWTSPRLPLLPFLRGVSCEELMDSLTDSSRSRLLRCLPCPRHSHQGTVAGARESTGAGVAPRPTLGGSSQCCFQVSAHASGSVTAKTRTPKTIDLATKQNKNKQ